MAVGRVRVRSLARVGFSIGWAVSVLPALLASALIAWVLRGIWGTLDGWTPWSPWEPNTRIAGFTLPTPEFRPREALRVDGLYQALAPIGQHPLVGAALGTLVLTVLGGIVFALGLILAGWAYNLFARVTGGIEFELEPREPRHISSPGREARPTGARRERAAREAERFGEDETPLRW